MGTPSSCSNRHVPKEQLHFVSMDCVDGRLAKQVAIGAPHEKSVPAMIILVERNSEIDTTVGAVCDRAQSLSSGKMRGHRPRLQKLWCQIHCYAPLDVTTGCQFVAGTGRHIPERVRSRFVSFLCRPFPKPFD